MRLASAAWSSPVRTPCRTPSDVDSKRDDRHAGRRDIRNGELAAVDVRFGFAAEEFFEAHERVTLDAPTCRS